jgi:hypothetical protein
MSPHQNTNVTIGNGNDWHCMNGDWVDGDDGALAVPADLLHVDGDNMQALHFAFNRKLCYQDCTVKFQFKLTGHTDTGIILRARDESHFYLLHFPNCGQASRGQHFWAALSKMDDSGYLRRVKLEQIKRVPSTNGTWLNAEITMIGQRTIVRIGDYGRFEVEDSTYTGPGHLGVYLSAAANIRNVTVQGTPAPMTVWNDSVKQPVNWVKPLPTDQKVWQQPLELRKFDDGELLMLVNIQSDRAQDETARALPHLSWSSDNGRTWSKPEPLDIGEIKSSWAAARIHITPKGRLIGLTPGTDHKLVSESTDRGRTWKSIGKTNLHIGPPRETPTQDLPPQGLLNLADGGILAFLLKGVDLGTNKHNIWTWGSHHCQAFSMRSDDDGATWSEAVNIDTPGFDPEGNQLDGNLDLTEPSAVQLGNGRIMTFIRPIYSSTMWETWSDDGGKTWGPCVRGPFPGYAAPGMVRTASGALVIAHRMPCLTVHCSLDDGLTWDQGTMIDSGLWAMGAMIEVEPDVVLYAYWDTYESLARTQRMQVTPTGLVPVR